MAGDTLNLGFGVSVIDHDRILEFKGFNDKGIAVYDCIRTGMITLVR